MTENTSAVACTQEFRKTNEAIGLRISEGKLSLLSRKLFNVMVYNAQQLKLPGMNAPIDTEANKKYFWIPLANIARDATYDSGDMELIKKHLEEFQNIKVHMEDEKQWISERLVSSVKLVNPSGLRKKGGQVWFGYAFPPEVFELVMNPITYTKFSIYYQGMLRSGQALALYEICRRYATNPSHKTSSETYDYWYGALTGHPVTEEPSQYKYFKRDVLKPAIAEINAVTDIEITLIEFKRGRKIERLQFEVRLKAEHNINLQIAPVINSALIKGLQKLGFSEKDASDICCTNDEQHVQATLTKVNLRMQDAQKSPLDSPAGYFRWALKNLEKVIVEEPDPRQPALDLEQKPSATPMEQFLTARAREALEVFKELQADESQAVFQRFKEDSSNRGVKADKGIDHPAVRSILGRWYAQDLWGEPTAEALSFFMEKMMPIR